MGSLSGTILDRIGGTLTAARVVLVPADDAIAYGGEVRIGAYQIELAADGSFTIPDLPDGTYRLRLRFYNPPSRAIVELTTADFPITGDTGLATTLGMALLTGPELLVIALDTDGQPYYVPAGTGTHSVHIDTDGQPYYDDPPGGEDVYSDVDGVPVILTLA